MLEQRDQRKMDGMYDIVLPQRLSTAMVEPAAGYGDACAARRVLAPPMPMGDNGQPAPPRRMSTRNLGNVTSMEIVTG